jgi:hypothetical protein
VLATIIGGLTDSMWFVGSALLLASVGSVFARGAPARVEFGAFRTLGGLATAIATSRQGAL